MPSSSSSFLNPHISSMNPPVRLMASCTTPCSLRTRFALRFLKTLVKIKRSSPPPPSSSSTSSLEKTRRRTQRIKRAAYSSMARAVGRRRAWSQALMLKLKFSVKRTNQHPSLSPTKMGGPQKAPRKAGGRILVIKRKNSLVKGSPWRGCSGVDELRRLVPGGESMGLGVLLEETAHFVRCLETQVSVMRSIADCFPC
ncbi:hypothetical protein SAY86_005129 [Trapa natans]|uniref:IBH1-like N-terminal domain-containing protein n=1 Tax=Trapa natans TaxID=22666 RepID=A0AAN7L093_TRANT|nr:hypothetical protein SAY86_005129 [Trapa natans]